MYCGAENLILQMPYENIKAAESESLLDSGPDTAPGPPK
jgi:hypothetical protein